MRSTRASKKSARFLKRKTFHDKHYTLKVEHTLIKPFSDSGGQLILNFKWVDLLETNQPDNTAEFERLIKEGTNEKDLLFYPNQTRVLLSIFVYNITLDQGEFEPISDRLSQIHVSMGKDHLPYGSGSKDKWMKFERNMALDAIRATINQQFMFLIHHTDIESQQVYFEIKDSNGIVEIGLKIVLCKH